MKWRDTLRRTSLILGLISLALAMSTGIHVQHLLDNGGGRHVGEVVVSIVLALSVFAGSWYGARQSRDVLNNER